MTPPSVLLVHEFPGAFGGAERYLELLGGGLAAAGGRVAAVVFVADPSAAEALRGRLSRLAPDTTVLSGRSRPGPIGRAVRTHAPDVIHWNFVDPFAFRGASWLLWPWGRPSVITDHLPQLRHAGPHWETTRRIANHRIRVMIVVGEAARREAAARWRRPPPIEVVANGVVVGGGTTRRPVAPGAPLRLLFVGRLSDQKGARLLVPILSAVRDAGVEAHLRVVGDGPLAPDLSALAAAHEASGLVELAGFSSDPLADMAAADVLVAPSTYEGLPFTPLEALAAGLPVVLSDIPPHAELVAGGPGAGAQLVDQGDLTGWGRAVRRVAADLPAASLDALSRAEDHRVEAMVERTVAVYRRATA